MDLFGALMSVVWYNGLGEIIKSWKNLPVKDSYGYKQISCPEDYGLAIGKQLTGEDIANRAQLQVFWMLAVEQFGSCGTSPRFGWIEDVKGFYNWIDQLTADDTEIIE